MTQNVLLKRIKENIYSTIRQQKTAIICVWRRTFKERQPQTKQGHKQQETMEPYSIWLFYFLRILVFINCKSEIKQIISKCRQMIYIYFSKKFNLLYSFTAAPLTPIHYFKNTQKYLQFKLIQKMHTCFDTSTLYILIVHCIITIFINEHFFC